MSNKDIKTTVETGIVRFLFPHLEAPSSFDGSAETAKYSVSILIPKTDKETIAAIQKAYNAAVEIGKEQTPKFKPTPLMKKFKGDRDGLILDCDKVDEWADSEVYAGQLQIMLKNKRQPLVMAAAAGRRPLSKDEVTEHIYGGCYGRVKFNFYPYSKVGMGITTSLLTVAKYKDGERLGGAYGSLDDFDDFGEADDLADLGDLL